jgi:hypothetical protein
MRIKMNSVERSEHKRYRQCQEKHLNFKISLKKLDKKHITSRFKLFDEKPQTGSFLRQMTIEFFVNYSNIK